MIRVTHAVGGKLFGGVETTLVTLARLRALAPEMEPRFALCFDGRLQRELANHAVALWKLNEVRARYPWSVYRARRELERRLRASPGPLVCHGPWAYAILAPAAKALGLPVALWLHGTLNPRFWLDRWALLGTPDLVIHTSNFIAQTCAGFFPVAARQVVFHTPLEDRTPIVPPEQRREQRAQLGASEREMVIIQVGRMERWKGHAMLLHALADLPGRADWRCWIVGGVQRPAEAAYLSELKALVQQRGLTGRVSFLGERTDVPALLTCADIFCSPNSLPEPFGSVFIEALYAGLPVVTGRWGGAEEILGDSDLMFPPADTAALSAVLNRLLQNEQTRLRARQWGPNRARELCDPARQMHRLSDILRELPNCSPDVGVGQQNHGGIADPRQESSEPR